MCSQLPNCVCDAEDPRGPQYTIKENKEHSFEVFDHLDRGKRIATFLYFKDAMRFAGIRSPQESNNAG